MRLPFSQKATGQVPLPSESALKELQARGVPLKHLDECATCDDPCDGQDAYAKLDIDLNETPMITSMKPYGRMAIVSTGKSDWAREVTESEGLAKRLSEAYAENEKAAGAGSGKGGKGFDEAPAIFPSSMHERKAGRAPARKVTWLCGSHLSPESDSSTCLVFPDYKIVQDVATSSADAKSLVETALAPEIQPFASTSNFRSWPLSYRAVILICSHKRRDKRCHVVAPYMINEITKALEAEGLNVDERGNEHEHGTELPLEQWTEEGDEREQRYERARRKAAESDTVGIFKVSHIGGHRYAGNVIICLPNGSAVWYGRVSPADCYSIVKETLIGGKVITELLRGGIGIEGKSSILAW